MGITSTDVNNVSFRVVRKGYDPTEVDAFVDYVASGVDELTAQIEALQNAQALDSSTIAFAPLPAEELSFADEAPAASEAEPAVASPAEIAARDQRIRELEAQVAEHRAEDSAIAQALIIAQRSADEILANAKRAAEQTRIDAENEAQRIIDKANAEKQRILDDIKQLEEDRETSRDKYADMLTEFIANSQDILSDLTGSGAIRGNHGVVAPVTARPAWNAPVKQEDKAPAAATYTTPTVGGVVATPATPQPTKVEKDFSGFGDTDASFEFDDVD